MTIAEGFGGNKYEAARMVGLRAMQQRQRIRKPSSRTPEARRSAMERLRLYQDPASGEFVRLTRTSQDGNASSALLVVYMTELRPPLQAWVQGVDSEAAPTWKDTYQSGHPPILGGIMQLALATGFDVRPIGKIVHKGTPEWVSLSKADALLSAAGLSHLLADGTVRVRPNPNFRTDTWEKRMRESGVDNPYEALT